MSNLCHGLWWAGQGGGGGGVGAGAGVGGNKTHKARVCHPPISHFPHQGKDIFFPLYLAVNLILDKMLIETFYLMVS